MNLRDLQKKKGKIVQLTVSIDEDQRQWIREREISPSKLLRVAINNLMEEIE